MNVSGINEESGEGFEEDLAGANKSFIEKMASVEFSEKDILRRIDNLDCSADVKALLSKIVSTTIKIGDYVVKIGRKIIDYVFKLFSEYPTVTFGAIFGAIAGFLISQIPVIGWILGPIVTPILIALGMIVGAREDLLDKKLDRKIAEIRAEFEPLKS